jgi:hypothetical protein
MSFERYRPAVAVWIHVHVERPLSGTDALPDEYVVQGQGYAPLHNVFGGYMQSHKCDGKPCNDNLDYDFKGFSICFTPDLLK